MAFAIASTSFPNGGEIPKKFTCDGADVSPELSWSDPPAGTQSFALIADDPDAPRATNAAMQSEYARLTDMSEAALKAALERYLPIVYVLCLLGNMWPTRRDLLVQRIGAALRSEF